MARKIDEQAAVIENPLRAEFHLKPGDKMPQPAIQVEPPTMTMSLLIDLEVRPPNGYYPRNFNFNVTDKLAKRFLMLKDSLHNGGVTFDDGNGTHHVDSDADVFRWWLASLELSPQQV